MLPHIVVEIPRRLEDSEVIAVLELLRARSGDFGDVQEAAGSVWWQNHRMRAHIARRGVATELRIDLKADGVRGALAVLGAIVGALVGVVFAKFAYEAGWGPATQAAWIASLAVAMTGSGLAWGQRLHVGRCRRLEDLQRELGDRFGVIAPSHQAIGRGETVAVPALGSDLGVR